MGTRINRIYNNPAIGQAFDNLASIFAPPEATDVLAYAQAAKARRETQGLDALFTAAQDPNADMGAFDKLGAATGQWAPASGFGARDMASADRRYGDDIAAATARRGQDIGSADSRYGVDVGARTSDRNNLRDNQRALITSAFQPLDQGQVRPDIDNEIMAALDLPGIAKAEGLPKPKTAEQVEGQMLLDAISRGMVGPQDAATAYRSDISTEEIVDAATGQPLIVARGDAIGKQPFVQPGSAPAKQFKTYTAPSGQTGIAVLDPQTGLAMDEATGQRLPEGTIIGDVTDTKQGMTTAFETSDQMRANAITNTLSTIDHLQELISANPAAQGVAGLVRGTAQDVMQTGNELGRLMGGTIEEVTRAAAADPNLAAIVPQMYDPNIPAIEMLQNVLAWQYAKSFAGDRVSNEQLRMAKAAIGADGWLSNQASSLARLDALRGTLRDEGRRLSPRIPTQLSGDLDPLLDERVPSASVPNLPQAQFPGAPAVGTIVEGHRYLGGNPNDMASWALVQ